MNDNDVAVAVEDAGEVAIGSPFKKCGCQVIPYDSLYVTMKCTLWQNGEPCGYLDVDKPAEYRVRVCLKGNLRYHLCGKLCVCVHIECLGPGPEITLPCVKLDLDPCDPDGCYDFVVPIPAGTLQPGQEGCGQVCCFTTTLTSFTMCDQPGHIACWCKGHCVMIYRSPH